jgi:hypothetical protein
MKIEYENEFVYVYLRDARGRLRAAHFSAPGMNQDTRAIFASQEAAETFLEEHGDQRRTYIISLVPYA